MNPYAAYRVFPVSGPDSLQMSREKMGDFCGFIVYLHLPIYEMEVFTQHSIELANQRNYLDQLFSVYPLCPDTIREISEDIWGRIENAYTQRNNTELFKSLLDLELFPVKDGYVPFFKRYRKGQARNRIIENNPATINRICGRIYEMGLDKLYERCSQPKETNRQMGPLFRRWLHKGALGVKPTSDVDAFLRSGDSLMVLDGSDDMLGNFARTYLGWRRNNKGLDFVAKHKNKYIIGEAKFITDFGGHQNAQFLDAVTTMNSDANPDVEKVAIIDGVPYIPNNGKLYKEVVSGESNIMSALLLREFIYSL